MGKPFVIIQLGDMLDDTAWLQSTNISALLWAGYPGQSGGTAVFDVLTGKAAPAGRLPLTKYPANYVNEVPMTDQSLRPSDTSPGRTYRWYNSSVLPFGYGLHYTNFSATFASEISNYSIQQLVSLCNETFQDLCAVPPVPVAVTNIGNTTSDYVALLFSKTEAGPSPAPLKTLVSYSRMSAVASGQTSLANLTIQLGELARRDSQGNLILYPGTYNLELDYNGIASSVITLSGSEATLETWPQPSNSTARQGSWRA